MVRKGKVWNGDDATAFVVRCGIEVLERGNHLLRWHRMCQQSKHFAPSQKVASYVLHLAVVEIFSRLTALGNVKSYRQGVWREERGINVIEKSVKPMLSIFLVCSHSPDGDASTSTFSCSTLEVIQSSFVGGFPVNFCTGQSPEINVSSDNGCIRILV